MLRGTLFLIGTSEGGPLPGIISPKKHMKLRAAGALVVLLLGLSCASVRESNSGELKPRTSPVQVGEVAPNFTLKDQQNRNISLPLGKASAVMVFYRGHW